MNNRKHIRRHSLHSHWVRQKLGESPGERHGHELTINRVAHKASEIVNVPLRYFGGMSIKTRIFIDVPSRLIKEVAHYRLCAIDDV